MLAPPAFSASRTPRASPTAPTPRAPRPAHACRIQSDGAPGSPCLSSARPPPTPFAGHSSPELCVQEQPRRRAGQVRTNQLKRNEFQFSVAKIDSVTTGASTYLGSTGYAARPARRACDSSLFRDTMPTFETYVPSKTLRRPPHKYWPICVCVRWPYSFIRWSICRSRMYGRDGGAGTFAGRRCMICA